MDAPATPSSVSEGDGPPARFRPKRALRDGVSLRTKRFRRGVWVLKVPSSLFASFAALAQPGSEVGFLEVDAGLPQHATEVSARGTGRDGPVAFHPNTALAPNQPRCFELEGVDAGHERTVVLSHDLGHGKEGGRNARSRHFTVEGRVARHGALRAERSDRNADVAKFARELEREAEKSRASNVQLDDSARESQQMSMQELSRLQRRDERDQPDRQLREQNEDKIEQAVLEALQQHPQATLGLLQRLTGQPRESVQRFANQLCRRVKTDKGTVVLELKPEYRRQKQPDQE